MKAKGKKEEKKIIKEEENKKECDNKDKKICELTDTLQRLQAEFENYKKYVEKKNSDFVKYAKADVIDKMLPIMDSFEMALKHTENKEEFIKGVEMIFSEIFTMLEKEGLKRIDIDGKFDPNYHEVLMKVDSDKEEDTILEELQKGYMLENKVLRYTKVKVSKGKK